MKEVPLTLDGKVVGTAVVENGRVIKGTVTDPTAIRWLNEESLQYLSIGGIDED